METKNIVIQVIIDCFENIHEEDVLKNQDNLLNLGMNSIIFIEIVVNLERKFNIEFEDEMLDYSKFNSLSSICNYINDYHAGLITQK